MKNRTKVAIAAGGGVLLAGGITCAGLSTIKTVENTRDYVMEVFNAIPKNIFDDNSIPFGFNIHLAFAEPLKTVMRVTDPLTGLDVLVTSNGFGGNPFRFLNPRSLNDVLNGAKNGFGGHEIFYQSYLRYEVNFNYEIHGIRLPNGGIETTGYNNAIIEDFNQHVKSYIEKIPHGKVTPEMKNFLEVYEKYQKAQHGTSSTSLQQTPSFQHYLLIAAAVIFSLLGAAMIGFAAYKYFGNPEKKLELTSNTQTIHNNPVFSRSISNN